MTRKDYAKIANVIRARRVQALMQTRTASFTSGRLENLRAIQSDLTHIFGCANPRFNAARFNEACETVDDEGNEPKSEIAAQDKRTARSVGQMFKM